MRQTNGAELFGFDDPRASATGIIYVAPNDDREGVLAAILTQDKLGRAQIVVVLPAENRAFQRPVDFDSLKNMRRKLQAQLIIIAPHDSAPAQFARQRRFSVYYSLDAYKDSAPDSRQPRTGRSIFRPARPASSPAAQGGAEDAANATPEEVDTSDAASQQSEEPAQAAILPVPEPASDSSQAKSEASNEAGEQSEEPAPVTEPRIEPITPGHEQVIYLDPDEELNHVRERLIHSTARDITLVVPPKTQLRSNISWRLIHAWTRDLDKNVRVVSPDKQIRSVTRAAGFRVADTLEPSRSHAEPQATRFSSPTRRRTTHPLAPDQQDRFLIDDLNEEELPPLPPNPVQPLHTQPTGDDDELLTPPVAPLEVVAPEPHIISFPPSRPSSQAAAGRRDPTIRRPVTSRPVRRPPAVAPPPPRQRRSWLLPILLFLVILLIIGGGFFLWLSTVQSGQASSAIVFITPASAALHNTYIITAVTGLPNPAQRQVQARILSYTTSTQTMIVTATGRGIVPAVAAAGNLTFYNALPYSQTVASGTVLTDTNGVQIVTVKAALIPAANLPAEGSITVPAHAVIPGADGNISALDFNASPCCIPGVTILNATAFTGGQNQQSFTYVQQADIDAAASAMKTSLAQNGMAGLKTLLPPNEPLVDQMRCEPTIASDHNAGERAASVTISATDTCTGETYDQRAALSMAGRLLQIEAASRLGAGYSLIGTIAATVSRAVVTTAMNAVSLVVETKGSWRFRFSSAQQNALARLITGKSEQAAQNILRQQPGIAQASIQFPWPGATILPGNARQITIKMQG